MAAEKAYRSMHSDEAIRERLVASGETIVDEIAIYLAVIKAVREEIRKPETEAWDAYEEASRAAEAAYAKHKKVRTDNEAARKLWMSDIIKPDLERFVSIYIETYAAGGPDISGHDRKIVFKMALADRQSKCPA